MTQQPPQYRSLLHRWNYLEGKRTAGALANSELDELNMLSVQLEQYELLLDVRGYGGAPYQIEDVEAMMRWAGDTGGVALWTEGMNL